MKPKINRFLYGMTLFFITLTGFGQMPIYKRYYIADIPGLGWLAKFYTIHSMHYIFAALLIGLSVYGLLDLILNGKGLGRVTGSGMIKASLIIGLIATGGFLVVRNFSGIYFPHSIILMTIILHLGCCMALLLVTAYTRVTGKTWTC